MQNKNIVFAAPCIFDASFQAAAPDTDGHWGNIFSELLKKECITVILLPCTESEYCGKKRKKHGIGYYQNLDGYSEYCQQCAKKTADAMEKLSQEGARLIACLGIEHSPSCAVSYLYSHQGMLKRQGIFFTCLFQEIELRGLTIEKIGINRTHSRKAFAKLTDIIRSLEKAEDA